MIVLALSNNWSTVLAHTSAGARFTLLGAQSGNLHKNLTTLNNTFTKVQFHPFSLANVQFLQTCGYNFKVDLDLLQLLTNYNPFLVLQCNEVEDANINFVLYSAVLQHSNDLITALNESNLSIILLSKTVL